MGADEGKRKSEKKRGRDKRDEGREGGRGVVSDGGLEGREEEE